MTNSRVGTLLVAAAFAAAGCGSDEPVTKPTAASRAVLRVVSSITDGATLTDPVEWSASTSGGSVSTVDFLVDGEVRQTEERPPYELNEEGNGLVPALLTPGTHTLAVRANSAGGGDAVTRQVHITVPEAPGLPDDLAGDWRRRVSKHDITRNDGERKREDPSNEGPPPGAWTLHVQRNGLMEFDDPMGSGGAETLIPAGPGRVSFYGPPNWLLAEDRRGGFCGVEPVALYRWNVRGDTLTLRGVDDDHCADRNSLFQGEWKRIAG